MNKLKKTIIVVLCVLGGGIMVWYSYFYSPQITFETEDFSESKITTLQEQNVSVDRNIMLVHIAGAVKEEGVVKIPEDTRVIDVIEEAGGLEEDADLENVNLAYSVQDGQKIYIPSINDEEEHEVISSAYSDAQENIKVNINTATQTELESLPGVGPSIASSIITYRKDNGKFSNIEDLKNVSGIGESKFNKIKDYIVC